MAAEESKSPRRFGGLFRRGPRDAEEEDEGGPAKWSMGILNDKSTMEVPGMYQFSVLCASM
jgi:hypothetical protein